MLQLLRIGYPCNAPVQQLVLAERGPGRLCTADAVPERRITIAVLEAFEGMAKSMRPVVPPMIAAIDPLSKSSIETVPMNGSAMCTCGSRPPGITSCDVASLASRPLPVLPDPEPLLLFRGYGDSSPDFELAAWTHRPDQMARIKSFRYDRVWEALAEHGIEIPFPQRDLHIKSDDRPK